MAGNRVVVRFIGEDSSLSKSLRKLEGLTGKITPALGGAAKGALALTKGLAVLGAAGGSIKVVNGVALALQQLLPIALLLPAALLAGGAALATFKLATSGFADALGGDADAMKKLAPSARATVQVLNALKPKFDALKRSVQQNFFLHFSDEAKKLAADYLPMLDKRLPGIASGFNQMALSAGFALRQFDTKNAMDTILHNTAKTLNTMPNVLGNIVSGFVLLGGAGSKYLVPIGRFADGITDKFRRWVDVFVGSGGFDRAVGAAKAGFSDLFAVIRNVGSVLGSVWKGLSFGSGASSPLSTLRDMTGALKDFFASAAAQGPLHALGETMSMLSTDLRDVLLAALRAIAPLLQSLAPIAQALGGVVKDVLVAAFDQLGPPIKRLIDRLGPLLIPALQWIGSVITDYVIPALGSFIDWLAGPGIDQIELFAMQSVAAFLDLLDQTLGVVSGILGAFQGIFRALSFLPGEFGRSMGAAADATGKAKDGVDTLQKTVDAMHGKSVDMVVETERAQAGLFALQQDIRNIQGKTVSIGIYTTKLGSGGIASAGRLAAGGTAGAGKTYMVGERGPEMLTMGGKSGHVTPTDQLYGGGGAQTLNFGGNVDSAMATAIMHLFRTKQITLTT